MVPLRSLISACTAAALLSVTAVHGKLHQTVITLGGIPYYPGPVSVGTLGKSSLPALSKTADVEAEFIPFTLIKASTATFTTASLVDSVNSYSSIDDVFNPAFLSTVLVEFDGKGQFSANLTSVSKQYPGIKLLLSSQGSNLIATKSIWTAQASLSEDLPKGPYFVSPRTGEVHLAYRLYSDPQLIFNEGAVTDGEGGYMPIPVATEGTLTKTIAVPSRLYYTVTKEKPLAGLRLGVKDIYHVKGMKTSGGNRAYGFLYPEHNTTGPAITTLLEAGAVLVGKTGTVQFANGDNPTADWVDFHCPFNSRGDGYQGPGGSSSGSGAGIGSYDWLDIAIGSDTGGSMRSPSGMNGVFGNRPSVGAQSLDNVIPLSPYLDTAGVFARSAVLHSTVTKVWYKDLPNNHTTYPKKIYYPTWSFVPGAVGGANNVLESFVTKLEGFLGTKRTEVNLTIDWSKTHLPTTPSDINEMLNLTYAAIVAVDQFNLLAKPFYADYGAVNGGRKPYINPGPLGRWTWGQENGGDAIHAVAITNKTYFKTWWESGGGYGHSDPESCSEGIFIYPQSVGKPSPRDVYLKPPTPPFGFSNGRIAVFAETPDLVVPVGEIPYNSTASLKKEYMPVTMSLLVARGCDHMLGDLIVDLEKAGIVKPVAVGTKMYP